MTASASPGPRLVESAGQAPGAARRADGRGESFFPAAEVVPSALEEDRPRWRGRLHQFAVPAAVAIGGCVVTSGWEHGPKARLMLIVFAVCAVNLYATSALYHRRRWTPSAARLLQRIDHANIFLFTAATYAAFAVAASSGARLGALVGMVGAIGLGGACLKWFAPALPRSFSTSLYIASGWAPAGFLPGWSHTVGAAPVLLLAAGGLWYSLGGVVYGARWPDPWPRTFGFHELFHATTIVGFGCHAAAILLAVQRA